MGEISSGKPFDYIFGTVSIKPTKKNPFEFLSTKILSCDLARPNDITTFMREIDALHYSGHTQLDDAFEGVANCLLQHKNTIKEDTKVEKSNKITLKVGDVLVGDIEDCCDGDYTITSLDNGIARGYDDRDYPSLSKFDTWYVNGVQYATEDIIIPQINEEYQEITPENILQTLYYNGIAAEDDCSDEAYRISSCGTALIITPHGFSSMVLNFSNPKWLQHVELEFGKLKLLPKQPSDLPTWVQLQGDTSISVSNAEVNYRIYVDGFFRALIPTEWSLERQINAVQQLINIYKGDDIK